MTHRYVSRALETQCETYYLKSDSETIVLDFRHKLYEMYCWPNNARYSVVRSISSARLSLLGENTSGTDPLGP